jgi:PAS domain S-box-containing protein
MKPLLKKKLLNNPILTGSLVFLMVLVSSQYLVYQNFLLEQNDLKNEVAQHAQLVEQKLQVVLNQSLAVTKTLGFIVKNYDLPDDFNSISRLLLNTNQYLDALELVDSTGIITHVYPLKGNEVLGFNILKSTIAQSGAIAAIQRKDYYMSGPIPLRQGGIGFLSRSPIFSDSTFLGFSAALTKLPTLMKAIRIDSLQNGPYAYQLSKVNNDASSTLIFSSKNYSPNTNFGVPIKLQNTEWQLQVVPVREITWFSQWPFSLLGAALAALCGLIIWQFTRMPVYLNRMVRQKTKMLRESTEKFKTLVNQASDGIFLTTDQGIILEVNHSGAKMLGYTTEELVGRTVLDIYDREELKYNPLKYKALINGEVVLHERRMMRKDGSYFYGEINAKKVPRGNFMGIVRDITERKQSNKILQKQNEELEKTTSELNQFVYSASHELRAPLSSLLGLIAIIKSEHEDNSLINKLKMMEKAVENLDGFIKDIIQYSKNKHLPIQGELIHFKELVDTCLANLWFLPERNDIAISVEIQENASFFSDKKRVSILLNNVVSNAIKYHEPKGGKAYIKIKINTGPDRAVLEIADNGRGIPKESLNNIFKMFYRAPSKVPGSGLGLYIVKEVLAKLQGTIEVKSKLAKGTKVKITIPNQEN